MRSHSSPPITYLTTRARRFLAAALPVILLAAAGWWLAPPAFARVLLNTIDPRAVVTDNGRHLVVTGPIACTAGERSFIHVTVSQRTTGAVAEGSTAFECSGSTESWEVHATAQGKASFEPGAATAVALARTVTRDEQQVRGPGPRGSRGDVTDAHQWLVNIELVAL
jgi:hypothetical protein